MMKMKNKTPGPGLSQMNVGSAAAGAGAEPESTPSEWELRPGGMLVQKRSDSDQTTAPPPTIRVRVKYGSTYHEIYINSQATFGELKKLLVGPTGLHHEDQKLLFKDKERNSKAFLDTSGVKDRSKIVLLEDPLSQEKRFLEMRRNAKMEKAAKSISEISLEVDRLGGRVSAFESIISKGGKVVETDVLNLIELLMNQLLKLDGIVADGDVKLQRKMQVRRVQKYVETLDLLKVKNSMPATNGVHTPNHAQQKQSNGHRETQAQEQQPRHYHSNGQKPKTYQDQQEARHSFGHSPRHQQPQQQQPSRHSASSGAVVITTNWETFDAGPASLVPMPASSTSTSPTTNNKPVQPKFTWNLL
ncbi:BAG family molecular chaperone regulator 3 [Humulus lupulus]|uniref:BAG family molecular chaperone regulator 3 n=1 Tax=Humulus lupulus TaxID=3486 RepID=UPI002B401E37|nr:BAG family molecular chaperone regulator 3 [Humulus lupulus]